MLNKLQPRTMLVGLLRMRSRNYQQKTVPTHQLDEANSQGWAVHKKNKKSFQVRRDTPKSRLLEDRIWTLMYRMGFDFLSESEGCQLVLDSKNEKSPEQQIDVVAVDDVIGLAIECKTFESPKKDSGFSSKLTKLRSIRRKFSDSIRKQLPTNNKRHVSTIMVVWDYILTDANRARAEQEQVVLLDESEITYYEELVAHLGPAAKYQFLADIFPGKQIPGLEVRVPALESKMGGHTCYTFTIHPEYLLKIAFVSHRAKGKATDVDAYQRMIKKSRLKKIREYISDDGMFPTNIVLNVEKSKHLRFDRGKQEGKGEGGRFGWLTLSPTYKSAWVIDGQHRLFAYSGHDRSCSDYLSVLAFKNLPGSVQARIFVDINHEQKSVKRALLDEIWAELHWDASDFSKRVRAVISKSIQVLASEKDSPLYGRILFADGKKSDLGCISLSSLMSALDKEGMYLGRGRRGVEKHGPLWGSTNNLIMRRTIKCLTTWFAAIRETASDWWDRGAGDGGGLAMNDGVTVCINVLKSVFDHLSMEYDLAELDDDELADVITPYAQTLGNYFDSFSESQRVNFRATRGVQGQTSGTKEAQVYLSNAIEGYDPPGLSEFIERANAGYNDQAMEVIQRIELLLQDTVLCVLKEEYVNSEDAWWYSGVPKTVRKVVTEKIEESDGKAGDREKNFDIIHYRKIILHNWILFDGLFSMGKSGNKDKKTSWISEVNTMRNKVMHASRREYLSSGDVERLLEIERSVRSNIDSSP